LYNWRYLSKHKGNISFTAKVVSIRGKGHLASARDGLLSWHDICNILDRLDRLAYYRAERAGSCVGLWIVTLWTKRKYSAARDTSKALVSFSRVLVFCWFFGPLVVLTREKGAKEGLYPAESGGMEIN
jgi:hypothetical protein